jgi:hypothetical protein
LVRLATLKGGTIFPRPTSPLGLLSLDQLVCPRQQIGGNRHADLPSSLQVDHQLKLRRPHEVSTSFDPKRNTASRRMGQWTIPSQHRVSFDGVARKTVTGARASALGRFRSRRFSMHYTRHRLSSLCGCSCQGRFVPRKTYHLSQFRIPHSPACRSSPK